MNKSELLEAISATSGKTKEVVGCVLESLIDTITDALKDGHQVVLQGFGSFSIAHRPERAGRNPQTGAPIKISASKAARFRPSKVLKDKIK